MAYRWFREGILPVPAVRVSQRTVLVSPDALTGPAASSYGLDARVFSRERKADQGRRVARLTWWAADAGGRVVRVKPALSADGRRLVVPGGGPAGDDLVRDMAGVLTSSCARLCGRGPGRNRVLKAVGYARREAGPRVVFAENVGGRGHDGGVVTGEEA